MSLSQSSGTDLLAQGGQCHQVIIACLHYADGVIHDLVMGHIVVHRSHDGPGCVALAIRRVPPPQAPHAHLQLVLQAAGNASQ